MILYHQLKLVANAGRLKPTRSTTRNNRIVDITTMLPTFLSQLVAGTLLIVAALPHQQISWKYLRLIAIVCLAVAFLAVLPLVTEGDAYGKHGHLASAMLGGCMGGCLAWTMIRSAQKERIRPRERLLPAISAIAALIAAVALALRPDVQLAGQESALTPANPILIAVTTILGALLLGATLAGMLLGHRYLTDTDMPIAPLLRLTHYYLAIVAARLLWSLGFLAAFYFTEHEPIGDVTWFYVLLSLRVGTGLIGTSVFAYMIWDCVRRRATQSATAIYYLSMLFVIAGELTAQYLLRTQALPV